MISMGQEAKIYNSNTQKQNGESFIKLHQLIPVTIVEKLHYNLFNLKWV